MTIILLWKNFQKAHTQKMLIVSYQKTNKYLKAGIPESGVK